MHIACAVFEVACPIFQVFNFTVGLQLIKQLIAAQAARADVVFKKVHFFMMTVTKVVAFVMR